MKFPYEVKTQEIDAGILEHIKTYIKTVVRRIEALPTHTSMFVIDRELSDLLTKTSVEVDYIDIPERGKIIQLTIPLVDGCGEIHPRKFNVYLQVEQPNRSNGDKYRYVIDLCPVSSSLTLIAGSFNYCKSMGDYAFNFEPNCENAPMNITKTMMLSNEHKDILKRVLRSFYKTEPTETRIKRSTLRVVVDKSLGVNENHSAVDVVEWEDPNGKLLNGFSFKLGVDDREYVVHGNGLNPDSNQILYLINPQVDTTPIEDYNLNGPRVAMLTKLIKIGMFPKAHNDEYDIVSSGKPPVQASIEPLDMADPFPVSAPEYDLETLDHIVSKQRDDDIWDKLNIIEDRLNLAVEDMAKGSIEHASVLLSIKQQMSAMHNEIGGHLRNQSQQMGQIISVLSLLMAQQTGQSQQQGWQQYPNGWQMPHGSPYPQHPQHPLWRSHQPMTQGQPNRFSGIWAPYYDGMDIPEGWEVYTTEHGKRVMRPIEGNTK